MKIFRPSIDRLESRQLMASDVGPACLPIASVNLDAVTADHVTIGTVMATAAPASHVSGLVDEGEYAIGNPILDYGLSSVIARSGSTVVVAGHTSSQVNIITQADGAAPQLTYSLKLNMGIQGVELDGQRALVFGQTNDDHTQVVAIDLASGEIVNRLQFGPGSFGFVNLKGSDAWIVLNQTTLVNGSPKDGSLLMHAQWTDEGLVNQASLEVPTGTWTIANDRLIMATASNATDFTTTVHLYDIGQGRLAELSTREFKNSYHKSLVLSDDGQRASLVRGLYSSETENKTVVDLLNLDGGTISVQQTLTIDDWAEIKRHDADQIIFFGQATHQVTAVDLRPNTDSQARTQVWDVPLNISLSADYLQLSNGRFGLSAYVVRSGVFFSTAEPAISNLPDGHYLVVIDPQSGQVQTVRLNDLAGRMFSIDADTDRIGVLGWSPMAGSSSSVFAYGHIDAAGNFVEENSFLGVDSQRDMALVFSNRLLTAADDRVSLFDLGNSGSPLLVKSIADQAPQLKALDWSLSIPKNGMHLSALLMPSGSMAHFVRTRIIALEGAPAGVEISDAHTIKFAPYEQSDRPDADFQYVITDGISVERGHIRVKFTDELWINPLPFPTDIPEGSDLPVVITQASATNNDLATLLKHNATAPLDVNNDGLVTNLDVLLVVNALNSSIAQWSDYWLDINNDGLLQPVDVLQIVNELNDRDRA